MNLKTLLHSTLVELKILLYVCRALRIYLMKLSKSEEELMNHLWRMEKAVMKDLIEAYPNPKPAGTTIATLLKRMQDKNFVDYKKLGRSREYFPLVKKDAYFSKHVNGLIKNFFNDSASQFASFFTKETDLTKKELEDLKKLIDSEIKKK